MSENAGVELTRLTAGASFAESSWRCQRTLLKAGQVNETREMQGAGRSVGGDRRGPESRRNTCGRYPRPSQGQDLNWPEAMRPIPGPGGHRSSKPHTGYAGRQTSEGAGKLRGTAQGGQGEKPWRWCSIPESCVSPCLRDRQPGAAMRFEPTREQAEADWGSLPYIGEDGKQRRIRVFVPGVRDDPGLVPDLIRELVRRAAAEAALNADARKIPGTEAARPRRRTCHSGPLRGHNGVLAPWVNSVGHPGLEKGRKRRRSTHQRGDRPPPPEILRSGTGEGVERTPRAADTPGC